MSGAVASKVAFAIGHAISRVSATSSHSSWSQTHASTRRMLSGCMPASERGSCPRARSHALASSAAWPMTAATECIAQRCTPTTAPSQQPLTVVGSESLRSASSMTANPAAIQSRISRPRRAHASDPAAMSLRVGRWPGHPSGKSSSVGGVSSLRRLVVAWAAWTHLGLSPGAEAGALSCRVWASAGAAPRRLWAALACWRASATMPDDSGRGLRCRRLSRFGCLWLLIPRGYSLFADHPDKSRGERDGAARSAVPAVQRGRVPTQACIIDHPGMYNRYGVGQGPLSGSARAGRVRGCVAPRGHRSQRR